MKQLLVLCSVLSLIWACQSNDQASSSKSQEIPEDFMLFYRNFHSDSIFQIEHINFPLEGLPSYADPNDLVDGKFYWQKEDWTFQKSIDFEFSDFERILMPINAFIIEETILHKKEKLAIRRKFVKFGDEWTLAYYTGLNPYSLD